MDLDHYACWSSHFSTHLILSIQFTSLKVAKRIPWEIMTKVLLRSSWMIPTALWAPMSNHWVTHFITEGAEAGWAQSAFNKSILTLPLPCPSLTMEKTSRKIYLIIFLGTEMMLTRLQISRSTFLPFRWVWHFLPSPSGDLEHLSQAFKGNRKWGLSVLAISLSKLADSWPISRPVYVQLT